jgi:hypothetical protein
MQDVWGSENKIYSRAWWRMPLIPALGRQRQADFWVPGQPGLQSEFQGSQDYTEKPWLKKQKKNQKPKQNKKTHKKKYKVVKEDTHYHPWLPHACKHKHTHTYTAHTKKTKGQIKMEKQELNPRELQRHQSYRIFPTDQQIWYSFNKTPCAEPKKSVKFTAWRIPGTCCHQAQRKILD